MKKFLASIILFMMMLFFGLSISKASSLLVYDLHGEAEDFTGFTTYLQSVGWNVDTVSSEITLELLQEHDVFMVGGYRTPLRFPEDAIDDVESYVQEGGGLWVIGNYHQEGFGFNDNSLASQFGVTFNDDTVIDPTNYQDFLFWPIIHNLESHPITDGVNTYTIHSGCSLNVDNSNNIIARGDNDTYSDSYTSYPPVLAALEFGNGRVAFTVESYVFHSSVFADKLSNEERRLLINIIGWLAELTTGELLYGVNSADDGLSLIDPQTGEVTFIGPLDQDTDPNFNRFSTPVAMAVRPSDQKIFVWNNTSDAANTGDLLTVDPLTGAATVFVEVSGQPSFAALAFAPDGRLFAHWNQLFEINLLTGELSSIGSVGPSVSGAAFSPDGILWCAGLVSINGQVVSQLSTVDTSTGVRSVVAELDVDVGTIGSIVFDPSGKLIGSGFNGPSGNIIFDIDTIDGSVSNIRSITNGSSPQGMGFVSSTTLPNQSPSAPQLSWPEDNEPCANQRNFDLQWSPSEDPQGDPIEYCVTVKEGPEPDDITVFPGCNDQIFTSYTSFPFPGSLQPFTTYYWSVRARDDQGNWSPASLPWSFTTIFQDNWYDAYEQSIVKEPDSTFGWVSDCLADPEHDYPWNADDVTGETCQWVYDNVNLFPIPAADVNCEPSITPYLDDVWDNQISSSSTQKMNTVFKGMPHPDRRFEVISRVDDHPSFIGGTNNLEAYFFTYDSKDDANGRATIMDQWLGYLYAITFDYGRPIDTLTIFAHGDPGLIHMSGGITLEDGEWGFKFLNNNDTEQAFTQLKNDGILAPCDSVILLFACRLAETESGKEFVQKLADWSGATVYANTQSTGNPPAGDWDLDVIKRPSNYSTCQITKSQAVGAADEASFMFPGGLIIEIPAESLTSNGTILVTDVTDQAKLELVDTENLHQAWDILFNETSIADQATVTVMMPVGLDLDLTGIDTSRVSVKYWDIESESWSDLGITNVSVNEDLDIVTFQTSHATVFGVFIANQPPEALCQNETVPTEPGLCIADASVNEGSSDADGDPISFDMSPAGPYDVGTTNVTLTVTDKYGASDSCAATVTVEDQETPVINNLAANPNILWPPNHKMKPVTVTADASDNCDSDPVCLITEVTSNEPVDGTDDGDTAPDWEITGDLTVNLRAERSGEGSGRIYTITVECADASGNTATADAFVTVPLNQQ